MAKTPERAMELMEAVWPAGGRARAARRSPTCRRSPTGGRGDQDRAVGLPLLRGEGPQGEVRPRRERGEAVPAAREAARGDVLGRRAALRPPLHARRRACPSTTPTCASGRSRDGAGKHVGLWYFDPYAREGKRSGAWMNAYRNQERFDARGHDHRLEQHELREGQAGRAGPHLLGRRRDALPRVRPRAARPRLERHLPVALRHERRPRLRRVPVAAPRALARDAGGARRGSRSTTRPASRSRRRSSQKIERASKFNQGFATVEYLAAAIVDMKMHLAGDAAIDPAAFERDTLAALGMPREIVMRHRLPHFAHVFSGDGYSAGYYSYLWADTLSADAYEAFVEAKGPYDKAVAKRLASTSSPSATRWTRRRRTAPSAAATRASARSCASAGSRSRAARRGRHRDDQRVGCGAARSRGAEAGRAARGAARPARDVEPGPLDGRGRASPGGARPERAGDPAARLGPPRAPPRLGQPARRHPARRRDGVGVPRRGHRRGDHRRHRRPERRHQLLADVPLASGPSGGCRSGSRRPPPSAATARGSSSPAARSSSGDVVRLSAGDLVPADARLLEASDLHVQQAALTGESLPAEKAATHARWPRRGRTRRSWSSSARRSSAARRPRSSSPTGPRHGLRRHRRAPRGAPGRDRVRARHAPLRDAHPADRHLPRPLHPRRQREPRARRRCSRCCSRSRWRSGSRRSSCR